MSSEGTLVRAGGKRMWEEQAHSWARSVTSWCRELGRGTRCDGSWASGASCSDGHKGVRGLMQSEQMEAGC